MLLLTVDWFTVIAVVAAIIVQLIILKHSLKKSNELIESLYQQNSDRRSEIAKANKQIEELKSQISSMKKEISNLKSGK